MNRPDPNLETGPIDFDSRQRLMYWVMAEQTAAERLDPEDTKTVFEAIEGFEDVVLACYNELMDAYATESEEPRPSGPVG